MNPSQRKDFVNQQITKLNSLLEQWERYQVVARDPGEKEHSRIEIERLKQMLLDYESEQKGGAKVDEYDRGPLVAPAIRKNNRKWIIGLIIAILLFVVGFFIYTKITEVKPDYDKYLSYLNKGDSLVKANDYPGAKESYKKALQYNPGDSAVTKKMDYLKKADALIAQNKFAEAKAMFQVVIEIAPSPGLSDKAIAMKGKGDDKSSSQLQFSFEWKDGMLVIRISGGSPFHGPGTSPYTIEGLNCKDCIQWTPESNGFSARIQREKLNVLSIKIKDSKGMTTAAQIPPYSVAPISPGEPKTDDPPRVNKTDNTDQNFASLIEEADKSFAGNKFAEALDKYLAAIAIKPANAETIKKIDACKKKIADEQLNAAKNIPRVSVSGGSFTMGNENGFPSDRPEHTVKLSAFSLSKTEVTVAQYKAYCGLANRPMPAAPATGWIDENPITNITWEEARAYCEWVGGRLPSEAEWEYAAKEAGAGSKNYSGSNDPGKVAVFKDNSGNRPSNVGKKQPNALGLYDMSGNVFEWCSDWFGSKYYASSEAANPKGPVSGKERVIRGGAYNSSIASLQDGNQLRVTYRNEKEPSARETYIGFRVLWDR